MIFLVFGMLYFSAYAQGGYTQGNTLNIDIMGVDLSSMVASLTDSLKGVGLIPDLSASCRVPDTTCSSDSDCSGDSVCASSVCYKANCNPLSNDDTKAFFMILLLLFMVLSIVIGLANFPSAIVAFFATSLLFNHLPSLFVTSVAHGLFEYTFSALFIFIWTDYIMKYMWAISPTTRLFLEASVTMIALFFMKIEAVYSLIETLLKNFLGTAGFIIFFVFMLVMHFINTFITLTNTKAARELRKVGSVKVQNEYKEQGKREMAQKLGVKK